jgi:hypothetical protein
MIQLKLKRLVNYLLPDDHERNFIKENELLDIISRYYLFNKYLLFNKL